MGVGGAMGLVMVVGVAAGPVTVVSRPVTVVVAAEGPIGGPGVAAGLLLTLD